MAVRLVVLDCDLTLWDHPNVSELRSPFTRADDETVVDADGIQVRLFPGAKPLLKGLRERGVLISIASWNRPEPVFEILLLLDLVDFFTRPKVEFHPYKERTITALLDELQSEGIDLMADQVLYVDDRALHLRRVKLAVGPVHTLQPGTDITDLRQVLEFVDSHLV
ncbi:MAG TPA: magnesium-dependent phosphatase-1 [bacterium]|nr:magnesium-dependent phosphatase-1 [bacterium]